MKTGMLIAGVLFCLAGVVAVFAGSPAWVVLTCVGLMFTTLGNLWPDNEEVVFFEYDEDEDEDEA